jgi:phosphatidylinositol glycan class B
MLLTVALALVSPELFGNTLRPKRKLRTACAFVLGGMSVAIRFTSLAAFIPVGILLADQKPTNLQRIKFLLVPCALYGLVGITLSLTVDRLLYGFWTAPFLGSLHFNVIQGLGSLYGTHPVHWYFSAGIPAISGTMLPFVLYDNFTLWNGQPSLSGRNIWIIIFCYTMLHSLSAHKEFRFLLPILPLFCVRAGHVIYNKIMMTRRSQAAMILLFIVPNLVAVVYLGTFHQGAPILINQRIRQLLSTGNSTAINKRISIDYLMGCHSTPLYSHLHIPSILVDAWTLDCSPDCRASPDKDCESDIFYRDPVRFVDTVYSLSKSEPETCTDRDDFCPSETKTLPDLLAVYSGEAFILKAQLKRMGLVEVDRFAHSINGLKLGSFQFGDDFASESFRHLNLFGHLLEISLEDMVLYASKHVFDTKGTS